MYQLAHYKTVNAKGENEIVIQKSRFIADVFHVESEVEAQEQLQGIRKRHYNATHNCYAYVIGEKMEIQKASDDGEPSGTAGKPILEVIHHMGLTDVLVVVTRYFGGIKLGAGGLIRAYSQATTEGIRATGAILQKRHGILAITVDYPTQGRLEYQFREHEVLIQDVQFMADVTYQVAVPVDEVEKFTQWVTDLTSGQAVIQLLQEEYLAFPVEV